MIYFDNAATGGRKPDCVLSAHTAALRVCANPGRSGHKLSLSCAKTVQACRNALSDYFDGYGYDHVAFTKNCTEALNIALFGVLQEGDHVVASCMEHNSVLRPLYLLAQTKRITLDVCPLENTEDTQRQTLDLEWLKQHVTPKTKLVAITAASNVTGAMPNVKELRSFLPENTLLLCDGAQGAGHFSIKMRGAGIDLLTIAGHKGMLAAQGSGALLFSNRVRIKPLLYGGTGSMSISLDMPDFYPDCLEAGTLSFPAICSLLEGVRYLSMRKPLIEKRITDLTEYLIAKMQKMKGFTLFSTPNPCGIVAFSCHKLQSEMLAEILSNTYSIAVRGGLHCAPLIHRALHTDETGLLRVSFSHFNSKKEVDYLINALTEI